MAETPTAPTLAEILESFGPVEVLPLSRIQALTARAMTRNWTNIPHVTHMDRIDVTKLELTRKALNEAGGEKLSPTPFFIRAVASVLARLPQFNRSFDPDRNQLIQRKYCHVGLAVDAPAGLMVPVIRDCDQKTVAEIGLESAVLAQKARTKGLTLAEMSGGSFTVSALGPLGGSGFTPIVNGPEIAILGISRMVEEPYRGPDGGLAWRLVVPVALSYDHRAINGADAGRFMLTLQEEISALADTTQDCATGVSLDNH